MKQFLSSQTFLLSLPFWLAMAVTDSHSLGIISLLLLGLGLSYFDLKSQTYPLLPWLVVSICLALFYPPKSLTFFLLAIAGLAYLGWIRMGEGDFLYLATCSLILNLSQILWLIQISSLLGICYYLLSGNYKKRIAFIPCLYLGLAILIILFSVV